MSRLLLDANLSPALAEALRWRGHDAVHVNEIGLRTAPDAAIFREAGASGRAVVTHDADYLGLLRSGAGGPSVIHLSQRELQRDPLVGGLAQAIRLTEVLHELGNRLQEGIAVRVGARNLRIQELPRRGPRRREPVGGRRHPDRTPSDRGELARARRRAGPPGLGR
jgi:predicted nuclease of predicted toxin-antitoxin system